MAELDNVSTALDYFSKLVPWLSGLVVAATAYLVWRRTGSMHMLMVRLWTVIAGAKDCDVVSVKKVLDERAALMRFRFTTGIRARTLNQIDKLTAWCTKNDEDIGDIAACGKNFDIALPGVNPKAWVPAKWHFAPISTLIAILFLATITSFAGATSDQPFLQFKRTGTWFTVDAIEARPLFGGTGFALKDCGRPVSHFGASTGFDAIEIADICQEAAKPESKEYWKASVSGQRIALIIMGFYIGAAFVAVFGWFRQESAFLALRERLAERHRANRAADSNTQQHSEPAIVED